MENFTFHYVITRYSPRFGVQVIKSDLDLNQFSFTTRTQLIAKTLTLSEFKTIEIQDMAQNEFLGYCDQLTHRGQRIGMIVLSEKKVTPQMLREFKTAVDAEIIRELNRIDP